MTWDEIAEAYKGGTWLMWSYEDGLDGYPVRVDRYDYRVTKDYVYVTVANPLHTWTSVASIKILRIATAQDLLK